MSGPIAEGVAYHFKSVTFPWRNSLHRHSRVFNDLAVFLKVTVSHLTALRLFASSGVSM